MMERTIVSVAVGSAVTPLIVYLWGRAFPLGHSQEFESVSYATLRRRNGWVDAIATLAMLGGVVAPIFFVERVAHERMPWLFLLAPGLMVIAHFLWVCAATLPAGGRRFREFWRFYELRWGIGIRGIKFVYVPLGALGVFATAMLWL